MFFCKNCPFSSAHKILICDAKALTCGEKIAIFLLISDFFIRQLCPKFWKERAKIGMKIETTANFMLLSPLFPSNHFFFGGGGELMAFLIVSDPRHPFNRDK